jgi:hypothetical protein
MTKRQRGTEKTQQNTTQNTQGYQRQYPDQADVKEQGSHGGENQSTGSCAYRSPQPSQHVDHG